MTKNDQSPRIITDNKLTQAATAHPGFPTPASHQQWPGHLWKPGSTHLQADHILARTLAACGSHHKEPHRHLLSSSSCHPVRGCSWTPLCKLPLWHPPHWFEAKFHCTQKYQGLSLLSSFFLVCMGVSLARQALTTEPSPAS